MLNCVFEGPMFVLSDGVEIGPKTATLKIAVLYNTIIKKHTF